jgi:hypothetical protein
VSLIPAALATATALGVAGAPAGLVLPLRVRGAVVGVVTAGVGVAGGASGVAALGGSRPPPPGWTTKSGVRSPDTWTPTRRGAQHLLRPSLADPAVRLPSVLFGVRR